MTAEEANALKLIEREARPHKEDEDWGQVDETSRHGIFSTIFCQPEALYLYVLSMFIK